jgi:DNA invertase Pin-like site-specific DNA recombinase
LDARPLLRELMTVREARGLLIEWAAITESRDARVRSALVSGLTKSEISRLTGIARSTVDRILDSEADGPETDREGVNSA